MPTTKKTDGCKECGELIDRVVLESRLKNIDIPETARRAAAASVFCSVHCMLENIGHG